MSDSESVHALSIEDAERGLVGCNEGLTSERILEGDMGLSIVAAAGIEESRGDLGAIDVALDMRRTSKGLICFPSDWV